MLYLQFTAYSSTIKIYISILWQEETVPFKYGELAVTSLQTIIIVFWAKNNDFFCEKLIKA